MKYIAVLSVLAVACLLASPALAAQNGKASQNGLAGQDGPGAEVFAVQVDPAAQAKCHGQRIIAEVMLADERPVPAERNQAAQHP